MNESTTVTVGLDVHARSVRLAAVRADELLEERTLPYDEEAVERAAAPLAGVRCCYEAGPTGFGLYRHLVERGIDCAGGGAGAGAAAAGRSGQDRPAGRAQARAPARRRAARADPCALARSWRPRAIWCVPARTRAWIGCATGTGCRSSACATGGGCRGHPGVSLAASGCPSSASSFAARAAHLRYLPARASTSSTAGSRQLERAIRETAEQGPWRELVGPAALPARRRHADRARDRRRDRRLQPLPTAEEFMAFVGLVPSEHSSGEQRRQGSITKVGNSHVRRLLVEVGLARAPPAEGRLRARPPPARPRRPRGRARLALPATPPLRAGSGWPAAASRSRRSSSPAPASSPASSGRSRPSNRSGAPEQPPASSSGCARPHGEPSTASMRHRPPVTRDPRPRQLPTVPSHAVPTGEYQSDPPSLPRAIRCSSTRARPSTEPGPLTLCSISEA